MLPDQAHAWRNVGSTWEHIVAPAFSDWPAAYSFGAENAGGGTLALGFGDDPGVRRTAVVHAFVFQDANDVCIVQAQGLFWKAE